MAGLGARDTAVGVADAGPDSDGGRILSSPPSACRSPSMEPGRPCHVGTLSALADGKPEVAETLLLLFSN